VSKRCQQIVNSCVSKTFSLNSATRLRKEDMKRKKTSRGEKTIKSSFPGALAHRHTHVSIIGRRGFIICRYIGAHYAHRFIIVGGTCTFIAVITLLGGRAPLRTMPPPELLVGEMNYGRLRSTPFGVLYHVLCVLFAPLAN
jgi:hypothetical protein